MNPTVTLPKLPRGHFKCNHCKEKCHVKNGDWFMESSAGSAQIFLCKNCEKVAKGSFKRASLTSLKH